MEGAVSTSTECVEPIHDEVSRVLLSNSRARVRIEAVPGAGKTALIVKACVAAHEQRRRDALLAQPASPSSTEASVESLVLAYNRQLASDIRARLPPDGTLCLTFHSLCSRCLAPAHDDAQLLDAVERAERGDITPRNVPVVSRVFIDEAQDVREIYVRLVRVLELHKCSIVVAGDRNQLVYDFDPDAPATLQTLVEPWDAFDLADSNCTPNNDACTTSTTFEDADHTAQGRGPNDNHALAWSSFALNTSYRLTPPISALVNAIFRTSIVSGAGIKCESSRSTSGNDKRCGVKPPSTHFPVDVRVPKNMWSDLYDTLRDVLESREESDVLLLVDYKNGNSALRKLLNTVSRRGSMHIHIHGVDVDSRNDDDTDDTDGTNYALNSAQPTHLETRRTLTCGTYWSAKGLQCRTCIVLVPEQASRNPTYVALTRASQRLVVVLDSRRPHPNVCAALWSLSSDAHANTESKAGVVRYADDFARHVVRAGAKLFVDGANGLCKREWTASSTDDEGHHIRNLDRWTPTSNVCASAFVVVGPSVEIHTADDANNDPRGTSSRRSALVRGCSGDVIVQMCLVVAEFQSKRRVRAVEDIAHPTRLDRGRHAGAIRAGCASRFVSPFASDDELLADDLRSACARAYDRMTRRLAHDEDVHASKKHKVDAPSNALGGDAIVATPIEWADRVCTDVHRTYDSKHIADVAIVALSILSFDSWDHTMRALLPSVHLWSGNAVSHIDFVTSVIDASANYDLRLCGDCCHVRVHATTRDKCFHVVWKSSSADVMAAGLRAALHPLHVCTLVDVSARTCTDISVAPHDVPNLLRS